MITDSSNIVLCNSEDASPRAIRLNFDISRDLDGLTNSAKFAYFSKSLKFVGGFCSAEGRHSPFFYTRAASLASLL